MGPNVDIVSYRSLDGLNWTDYRILSDYSQSSLPFSTATFRDDKPALGCDRAGNCVVMYTAALTDMFCGGGRTGILLASQKDK